MIHWIPAPQGWSNKAFIPLEQGVTRGPLDTVTSCAPDNHTGWLQFSCPPSLLHENDGSICLMTAAMVCRFTQQQSWAKIQHTQIQHAHAEDSDMFSHTDCHEQGATLNFTHSWYPCKTNTAKFPPLLQLVELYVHRWKHIMPPSLGSQTLVHGRPHSEHSSSACPVPLPIVPALTQSFPGTLLAGCCSWMHQTWVLTESSLGHSMFWLYSSVQLSDFTLSGRMFCFSHH